MHRDSGRRAAPPPAALLCAGVVLVAWGLSVALLPEDLLSVVVSNIAQFLTAGAAAASLAWRAGRSEGRLRWTWGVLAAACASWAAGQAYWAVLEMSGHGIPFPSLADLGFLTFAVVAALALLMHPADGGARGRWQRASDATMTAAAVGLVSWQTSLGAVVAEGAAQAPLAGALLISYPAMDVVLVVLTVTCLSGSARRGPELALVGAGVVALSVSDSTFAYLQTTGAYSGGLVDTGWVVGFLLIALAGTVRPHGDDPVAGERARTGSLERAALLPYVPVVLGAASSLSATLAGRPFGRVEMLLATVVVGLLLNRQYLALRENVRLATELAEREALLSHQAFHDGLTGLANRALFRDRLEHALQLHARNLRPVTLVFLDLDDFKVVNDTRGHAVGDQLLVRVAERLTGAVRTGDTVARLGGDEFAVLLEDSCDTAGVVFRLLDAVRSPFAVAGCTLGVSASVGVCTLDADAATVRPDELLVRADLAMYAAKQAGKDTVVSYSRGLGLAEMEEQALRDQLRTAVADGQVTLEYQPIVDVGTGRITGLEALARWRPDGIAVGPDVFIPVAESAGLLDELTGDLLTRACADVVEFSAAAGRALGVHVNVAPSSLASPEFVESVAAVVSEYRLASGQLVLELTETGLLEDPEAAVQVITRLREIGVGVSLDDFGVGYSSLARLRSIPLDSIKVDRSFLERIDSDSGSATLFTAVLRLARDVGLPVVAEGVERPGQLALLRDLECPLAQGYLLGRPVPATAVPALLRRETASVR